MRLKERLKMSYQERMFTIVEKCFEETQLKPRNFGRFHTLPIPEYVSQYLSAELILFVKKVRSLTLKI